MDPTNKLIEIMEKLRICTNLEDVKSLKKEVTIECGNIEFETRKDRKNLKKRNREDCEGSSKEAKWEKNKILSLKQVGISVKDLKLRVSDLLVQGAFPEGVTLDDPEGVSVELLPTKMLDRKFPIKVNRIWECITNNEVSKVAVWGMGGVGKTTLVQYVYNKALKNRDIFGCVYWVTVSRDFSIYKLQYDIANVINRSILEALKDEVVRAGILAQTFEKLGKFTLFLDDMWNYFDLNKVGIPENDGCKLVITTRSLDICRQMRCDNQNIIQVDTLSKDDAWDLFVKYYSSNIQPHIKETAQQVVEECGGLPLGIVTLARSMRETDDIREWKNVLRKLERSELGVKALEDDVFRILRFSYNCLDDSQLQQCLLYCATYPEDYRISRVELIWGLIDAELIKYEEHTMEEMMDEGHTILNKLERACLLIRDEFKVDSGVTMHDLIRDMTLQLWGSKSMIKAGKVLRDFPSDIELWTEDITVVSLMGNQFSKISDIPPNCPKVSIMLLQYNWNLCSIPNDFFKQFQQLTVVDLSETAIEVLPESISCLRHLIALILSYCHSLQYVPSLENLTALRRLDLSFTKTRGLPRGLDKLTNLRYLNLEKCYIFGELPVGILPKLYLLQFLSLEGNKNCFPMIELLSLKRLEHFNGRIPGISYYNAYVRHMNTYGRPNEYRIFVSPRPSRFVYSDSNISRGVFLIDCEDLDCDIEFPKDIQLLIIRSLHREISLYSQSFSNLIRIIIYDCGKIKYLFAAKKMLYLPNLEYIEVQHCPQLEYLIKNLPDEDDGTGNEEGTIKVYSLPKLITLRLDNLSKLTSICSGNEVAITCASLWSIVIRRCPMLKKMPLHLPMFEHDHPNPSPSPFFMEIVLDDIHAWDFMEWDHLHAKPLLQPYLNFVRDVEDDETLSSYKGSDSEEDNGGGNEVVPISSYIFLSLQDSSDGD